MGMIRSLGTDHTLNSREKGVKMRLNIKLREGFRNETVIVKVDNNEVYHSSNVNTDLSISYADAVTVTVDKPVINLEVEVAQGKIMSKEIKVIESPFIEISLMDGNLVIREFSHELPML